VDTKEYVQKQGKRDKVSQRKIELRERSLEIWGSASQGKEDFWKKSEKI